MLTPIKPVSNSLCNLCPFAFVIALRVVGFQIEILVLVLQKALSALAFALCVYEQTFPISI